MRVQLSTERIISQHAAFGGSAKALAMRALGNYRTSKEDLAELKALINKIENEDQ